MVLTEEQRERIRKNRERALQIQKERREKQEQEKQETKNNNNHVDNDRDKNKQPSKKQKTTNKSDTTRTASSITTATTTTTTSRPTSFSAPSVSEDNEFHSSEPLEEFEEGASEWVTKTEAMNMYCLPEGSMAVCSYEEKPNPRNPSFKPMKLYRRSEIRYRAHKRHGGLEGLVKERNKRRQRKLDKDLEAARDIFK
eukprot:jgi/Psemu1/302126/fgenesh1_kg.58_\